MRTKTKKIFDRIIKKKDINSWFPEDFASSFNAKTHLSVLQNTSRRISKKFMSTLLLIY